MKYSTYILLIVLIGMASVHAETKWQYATPMPNARYGHDAVVGRDGRIYVMGGQVFDHKKILKINDGEYSNLVFDPAASQWTLLEPVPGWIRYPGKYYYYDDLQKIWISVKKSDDRPGYYKATWPKKQKGKIFRIAHEKLRNTDFQRQGDGVNIALSKDGRIFWIAGNGKFAGRDEALVLPYDPIKNQWPETTAKRIYYNASKSAYGDKSIYSTDIPPLNQRRMDHEAVTLPDGRIFVLGGYYEIFEKTTIVNRTLDKPTGENAVLDSVECYDPAKNTWEYKRPMFNKRFLFAAVVGRDNKIYVFGGGNKYNKETGKWHIYNTTEVYDPETDTWTYRKPLPRPAFSISGAVGADGRIYIMGGSLGQDDSPPLRDVLIYDPVKDTWKKGPRMNMPRSTLAAVSTPDGKIYAIGGTDAGAYSSIKSFINLFRDDDKQIYTGQIQDTVEVLDTNEF